MSMTANEVWISWLCNECYGKYFVAGFKHGTTSSLSSNLARSESVTISAGSNSIVAYSRNHTKEASYKSEFFNPHGYAPNGIVDTAYVSYWGDQNTSCWGNQKMEWSGMFDEKLLVENSTIYFADLRNDTIVYYNEKLTQGCSVTGSSPMGPGTGYGVFDNSEKAGCKGVNTYDAVKLPVTIRYQRTSKEIVTNPSATPYDVSQTNINNINLAASDRSG